MICNVVGSDFESIWKVHGSALPDDLLTSLSKHFLIHTFYPLCLESSIFLCYKDNQKLLGFIIIALNTDHLNKKLFYNLGTLREIFIQFTKKPRLIFKNVSGILFAKSNVHKNVLRNPEIYLIAVSNETQGQGIGSKLIKAVEKELLENGYSGIIVKTLLAEAKRFYQKNKFVEIGEEIRLDKRLVILYRKIM